MGLAGLAGGKGLEFSGAGGLALGLAGEMGAETEVGRDDSPDISGFSFTWWVSEGRCAGWAGMAGAWICGTNVLGGGGSGCEGGGASVEFSLPIRPKIIRPAVVWSELVTVTDTSFPI